MNLLDEATAIGMQKTQMNAILGSLLGDGAFKPSGATTKCIAWNHGETQKDYVQAKYELLQEFATHEPRLMPNPGYGTNWCRLTTKSLGILHSMYILMHPNNCQKKTVTPEFLSQITHPIALAWWFLDDGSRDKGHNRAMVYTNGFSEEENQLLSLWLQNRWGIESHVIFTKSSTTGNISPQLSISNKGYVRWMELIQEYVPDSMKYKTELVLLKCPVCGKEFPLMGNSPCCSKACSTKMSAEHKKEYAKQYAIEHADVKRAYRQTHKEEHNARERERYAKMTPEQKEALNAYAREWRERNHEAHLAYRRAWRASKKGDPEYEAKLKAERQRYYQRKKNDPERHQRMLEQQRTARAARSNSTKSSPSNTSEN